jgi:hypothetical protein
MRELALGQSMRQKLPRSRIARNAEIAIYDLLSQLAGPVCEVSVKSLLFRVSSQHSTFPC